VSRLRSRRTHLQRLKQESIELKRASAILKAASVCDQLTELGGKIAPATYHEHRPREPTAHEVRDKGLAPGRQGAR
jgi:hypothetical protein